MMDKMEKKNLQSPEVATKMDSLHLQKTNNNNSGRWDCIINDGNEKRVFPCGCTVEWHLDKIKFTDCRAHSDEGLELRALDNVTITV